MHEREKVLEAEFFLSLMEERASSASDLHHLLSAFLSAARSALQYALEEAKARGQQPWYDSAMNTSDILRFFKDKRDVNIHERPITLAKHVTVTDSAYVGISESVLVKIQRADGSTETREIASAPASALTAPRTSEVRVQFHFDDWQGPENVLTLSKAYLAELKAFIEAGITAGHISG
jgi:hypothetical protein